MQETSTYRRDHRGAFAEYDSVFQEKILHVLLYDREWATEIVDMMHPNMFEDEHTSYICQQYWNFYKDYKSFPTLSTFISHLRNNLMDDGDDALRASISTLINKLSSPPAPADVSYIKDKITSFCKKQNFKDALIHSVELMKSENYESIYSIMKHAVSTSISGTVGHDFFEDSIARWDNIVRNPISTGIPQLDRDNILDGGLAAGELGVVVAVSGAGKSHILVSLGAEAIKQGKNVVHYSFELSELAIGRRYDAHFTDIPSNEIIARRDEVASFYEDNKNSGMGQLYIKEYGTGTATVLSLKNHLEKLQLKGFVPDVVIVDYADIMRAIKKVEGERLAQKAVYEELRGLARELGVPLWTASQSNRDGASSEILTSENMAESYGKAQVSDFIMTLSRKPLEKASGTGRIFVAKNRMGIDGVLFSIKLDTACSKVTVLDEGLSSLQEAQEEDREANKQILKDVWQKASKKQWGNISKQIDELNEEN